MAEVVLFAGPSAHGLPDQLFAGIECRPPIRRGDIPELLKRPATAARERQTAAPVLIVCDGVFQSDPAVGHAELCRALDAGWRIWGVSSIGAIRAHELRTEGMRGFGWVYSQFAAHEDFTDDELCLLHLPMPPYAPLTEALVDLRYALLRRGEALGIGAGAQRTLLGWLGERWFGERSPEMILDILVGPLGVSAAAAGALLEWMQSHRIKSLDLARLLTQRPWLQPSRRALRSTAAR